MGTEQKLVKIEAKFKIKIKLSFTDLSDISVLEGKCNA